MAVYGTGSVTAGWTVPVNLTTLADLPISVSGWFRFGATPVDTTFFGLGNQALSKSQMVAINQNPDFYVDCYDDSGGSAEAGCFSAWTRDANWHHLLIQQVGFSGQGWHIYFDGALLAENNFGSTLGTNTFKELWVGISVPSAGDAVFATSSSVAELSVWRSTLMTAELPALASGESPLNLAGRGSLVAYFPLRNNLLGYSQGKFTSLVGVGGVGKPKWADHPKIATVRRPRFELLKPQSGMFPPFPAFDMIQLRM